MLKSKLKCMLCNMMYWKVLRFCCGTFLETHFALDHFLDFLQLSHL